MTPVEIQQISPTAISITVRDSYYKLTFEKLLTSTELIDRITMYIISNFRCCVSNQTIRNEVYSRLRNSLSRREEYLKLAFRRSFDDTKLLLSLSSLVEYSDKYRYTQDIYVDKKDNSESEKRRKKLLLLIK